MTVRGRLVVARRSRPMRVAIDARLIPGLHGGVEGVVTGLAHGLSRLTDSGDEYLFLALPAHHDFLRPFSGGNVTVLRAGDPPRASVRRRLRRSRLRAEWKLETISSSPVQPRPPLSDGTIEDADVDVMHFTMQSGFRTRVPSIYQPHDLQHVHLPANFPEAEVRRREAWYGELCRRANIVVVASRWTKRDVESHYKLPAGKVHVVPYAPVIMTAADIDLDEAKRLRSGLGISGEFILFPAQTWPHKNHAGLLKALRLLLDRDGVTVPLVAPGAQTEHFPALLDLQRTLGLSDQVMWPGFVGPAELQALYMGARAVVIPTRFEAGSFPLWEAFRAGVAAACSDVTSLPEQAGDAALFFDPDDIEGMAEAVRRLWTDALLRATLIQRGRERISGLSWERTARIFRAYYRRLAGRALSREDVEHMNADTPM